MWVWQDRKLIMNKARDSKSYYVNTYISKKNEHREVADSRPQNYQISGRPLVSSESISYLGVKSRKLVSTPNLKLSADWGDHKQKIDLWEFIYLSGITV